MLTSLVELVLLLCELAEMKHSLGSLVHVLWFHADSVFLLDNDYGFRDFVEHVVDAFFILFVKAPSDKIHLKGSQAHVIDNAEGQRQEDMPHKYKSSFMTILSLQAKLFVQRSVISCRSRVIVHQTKLYK